MPRLLPSALLALLVLAAPSALAQTAPTSDVALTAATPLSPAETAAFLAATPGAVVLDVRTSDEVAASGRLAGALVIDVTAPDFEPRARAAIPDGVPVVLYCRSGRRAEAAATRLAALGVGPLYNAGGFEALAGAGLATEPAAE
jgi:rhodanese-related sulfurtransferase